MHVCMCGWMDGWNTREKDVSCHRATPPTPCFDVAPSSPSFWRHVLVNEIVPASVQVVWEYLRGKF